jgi:hypothetical protein
VVAVGKVEQLEKVVATVRADPGEAVVETLGATADAGEAVARPSGERVL